MAALPLAAAHAGLLWTFDLAAHPWATFVWLTGAVAGLVFAARYLARRPVAGAAGILVVAGLLRLLLVALPPTLSDDVYRYVWDGRVVLAGSNPYELPPNAPQLEALRDDLWERLPHREVPTVYPPLALGLFSIASRLPGEVWTLKALLVAVDLVGCALLLRLGRRWQVPLGRLVWYAWNPLVTLEVAGMGHVDALGVAAVLGATLLVAGPRKRPVAAAAAAAGGVLVKLVPLAAVPVWARHGRAAPRFVLVALALVAAGLAPVAVASGGVPPGLVTYGVSWEFNGPLYEPLWRLLEGVGSQGAVEAALDRLKLETGRHELFNRLYPLNYARLHAKLLLGVGLLGALLSAWREERPVAALGRTFGALVVFSATVYPWYLLWVLPFAALGRQTAWLALSGLVLLSYLPQIAGVPLLPWVFLAVWLPFFALLWRDRAWSTA